MPQILIPKSLMKKAIIILIITIACNTIFAQANKLYRQATKATDLNEKVSLYSAVIALEPDNLDAYFYRAIAKNDLGDYSGAIVDYSKIILKKPDADTYYNRGNSRYSLKDFDGAKDDYEEAYKRDPQLLDALYSLGCVKYDLGEFESAIIDFSKIIGLVPTLQTTYFLRASAYMALKQYTKALEDYSVAIIVNPNAEAYYNRGVFYLDINYYQKANDDLNRALKLNNSNSFNYFYRGASFLLLGKYLDAISDFKTALTFDANDFDAMLGLSISYNKAKDAENAQLYFEKALSIVSPNARKKDVEAFNNTYWYQKQYYYFNENFVELSKL